jgi:hypothetical protein
MNSTLSTLPATMESTACPASAYNGAVEEFRHQEYPMLQGIWTTSYILKEILLMTWQIQFI